MNLTKKELHEIAKRIYDLKEEQEELRAEKEQKKRIEKDRKSFMKDYSERDLDLLERMIRQIMFPEIHEFFQGDYHTELPVYEEIKELVLKIISVYKNGSRPNGDVQ